MTEEQKKRTAPPQPKPKSGIRDAKKAARPPQKEAETEEGNTSDMTKGLGTVLIRNEFYRDGYRSLLKLVLLEGVAVLALIGIMFFIVNGKKPENRYFATTEDGRLIPMVPLSQPNLSSPALMSWVAQAATEVMTFNFNDYRRRLQESSRNFTQRGWDSFTTALQSSRMMERVEANQQIVTAAPRGAPVIQSEGLVLGRYQWVVQVPMIVTYQSGPKMNSDNLMVQMIVVRVPRLESPSGIGIEQWLAAPG